MIKSIKIKILLSISFILLLIIFLNYFTLQRHMNSILADDPRNNGVRVWVHYKWFINPTQLEYDLRDISGENRPLDVNRVMLQFAEKVKDKKFSKVYLAFKGSDRFYLEGNYFQNIGKEYEFQNPIYTLRTMPENIYLLNGDHAYGSWSGGWLGVMNKQMEDLNAFSKDWYLEDIVKENK